MSGANMAINAAERHRKERFLPDEEEARLRYSAEDLENWEFKMVRSATRQFHKPEVLYLVLEEESVAGWELLEKLDDHRLRFKRSLRGRHKDEFLPPGYDPYRSWVGISQSQITLILIILSFLLSIGLGLGVYLSI
ncbi:MAG: hypothetical protein DWQ07_10015 [Chloroflexi bacterium]|nr:MAG: hypothetical protein DWQ07_10015 [Chloroflexota bacterium]MBL1192954.1 hypothetical protein [Chloroflexota bacterium]NOH10246.1 hypothetical protein [Chloroflexota bacterium]